MLAIGPAAASNGRLGTHWAGRSGAAKGVVSGNSLLASIAFAGNSAR